MKKDTTLTIRFKGDLKDRVQARALIENRKLTDESAFLIEKGLDALERDEALLERAKAGLTDINPEAIRA